MLAVALRFYRILSQLPSLIVYCFVLFSGGVIIGYVHNLSEIKTSQRNNLYFDMSLQTQEKLYRALCFSPEKHQQCKTTCESSSPIKLTKYQLKRNTFTEQDEIHINKRT